MMSVSFLVVGCMLSTSSTPPCSVAFSATAGLMTSVSFHAASCMLSTSFFYISFYLISLNLSLLLNNQVIETLSLSLALPIIFPVVRS